MCEYLQSFKLNKDAGCARELYLARVCHPAHLQRQGPGLSPYVHMQTYADICI
jgi:hypothetical protein